MEGRRSHVRFHDKFLTNFTIFKQLSVSACIANLARSYKFHTNDTFSFIIIVFPFSLLIFFLSTVSIKIFKKELVLLV